MRKRVVIILGLIGLAIILILASKPREPYYEGKSLSDWIVFSARGEDANKRREALHRLGPNSIPLLLNWLQQSDRPSLTETLQQRKFGVLSWLEKHKFIKPKDHLWKTDMKGSHRALALRVFEEIGPEGRAAIPSLIKMLAIDSGDTNKISETAGAASLALSKMAPYSIPPLIEAAASTNDQIYALAAMALGLIGPGAKVAIPTIQKRFNDPRPEVRIGAAEIVSKLSAEPPAYMPMVINALRDIDLRTISFGTDLLLSHIQDAKGAIPILQERLRDIPDSTTNLDEIGARDILKSTLQQIVSEKIAGSTVH